MPGFSLLLICPGTSYYLNHSARYALGGKPRGLASQWVVLCLAPPPRHHVQSPPARPPVPLPPLCDGCTHFVCPSAPEIKAETSTKPDVLVCYLVLIITAYTRTNRRDALSWSFSPSALAHQTKQKLVATTRTTRRNPTPLHLPSHVTSTPVPCPARPPAPFATACVKKPRSMEGPRGTKGSS